MRDTLVFASKTTSGEENGLGSSALKHNPQAKMIQTTQVGNAPFTANPPRGDCRTGPSFHRFLDQFLRQLRIFLDDPFPVRKDVLNPPPPLVAVGEVGVLHSVPRAEPFKAQRFVLRGSDRIWLERVRRLLVNGEYDYWTPWFSQVVANGGIGFPVIRIGLKQAVEDNP